MGEFRVRIRLDGRITVEDRVREMDRLLTGVAVSLFEGKTSGRLFDVNGNEVGEFYFVDD